MSSTRSTLEALLGRQDLEEAQAAGLLHTLTDPECPPALAGALLAALRMKGETTAEVRGLASAMRELAVKPAFEVRPPMVDIVGTGGDGSGSLNLSTGTALLVAACGVPVVKHGNRSVSSKSGSADVLETLGLALPLDEQAAARVLEATGFTFLFAPYYHPAMKAVVGVRQALGVRTVFNILGPLTNPASPPYALIGAYSVPMARLMAEALAGSGVTRAWVVHGEPGWDEATPVGPFKLFDVTPGSVTETDRDPADMGFPRCRPEDLAGGDAAHNAARIRAVFAGEEGGAHRDALVLGAALVLELTGECKDASEARARAEAALDEGSASALLAGFAEAGT